MSYSVGANGATKEEAVAAIKEQLQTVLISQPNHKLDIGAASDVAEKYIDMLADPAEDQQIQVTVSGSLSWSGQLDGTERYSGSQVSVYANLVAKS